MSKMIFNGWLWIFLANVIVFVFNPFKRSLCSVALSLWGKLLPLSFMILLALISLYAKQSGVTEENERYKFLIWICAVYFQYAALLFGYRFDQHGIGWFNGIFFRRIPNVNVLKVFIYESTQGVRKFGFLTPTGEVRIRNDLALEQFINDYCHSSGKLSVRVKRSG